MKIYKSLITNLLFFMFFMLPLAGNALTYNLPRGDNNIIGAIQYDFVNDGESLADIGRRFDIGVIEMIAANPNLDPWVPKVGAKVVIPTTFVLPDAPKHGIVINLAELRLYYYHPDKPQVTTYPISIGQEGWATPLGDTKIVSKEANPTWKVPESILAEKREKGIYNFPKTVPPGPDNPLGKFAMRLGFENVLMHGTNLPGGIGMRVSHGCIRLKPADIAEFFNMVAVGTPVKVIHQPYKIGSIGNDIYLEAHTPMRTYAHTGNSDVYKFIYDSATKGKYSNLVQYKSQIGSVAKQATGMPTKIGEGVRKAFGFFSN